MLKYFSKSSSKVSAPQDFVICRTATPLIITTFGFVDAVSYVAELHECISLEESIACS